MPLSADDRLQIQALYARYSHALDAADVEAYATLFTANGVFESGPTGAIEGEAALRKFIGSMQDGPRLRHYTSNLIVYGDGGEATGTCYLMVVGLQSSPPSVLMTGAYRDQLVRHDGAWRFKRRSLSFDAAG